MWLAICPELRMKAPNNTRYPIAALAREEKGVHKRAVALVLLPTSFQFHAHAQ